jgi:hypothetical protein
MNALTQEERRTRTRIAIDTLERTRAELRVILQSDRLREQRIDPNVFPRSRTLRWALDHPLRRLIGSGFLTGTLSRLLLARLIGAWIFRKS